MCYLYNTIHEIFEAKDLNIDLFKEFINKYRDNEYLQHYLINAIKTRAWMTSNIHKICKNDNNKYFYYPFDKTLKNIHKIIKKDNVDSFIQEFNNIINSRTIIKILRMIYYHGAVNCLKFILLQKDEDYFNKYLINCIPFISSSYENMDDLGFYKNLEENNKFKFISAHDDIIKTIREIIGFNERFETLVAIDALNGLNFNVIKDVENEYKIHDVNNKIFNLLKSNYIETKFNNKNPKYSVVTFALYKKFSKRDLYRLCNKNTDLYNILKEYFDYLCEVTFDKDYDKELMNIVICEKSIDTVNYDNDYDLFKKYNDIYLVGLTYIDIDLKNNSIYNMLSQTSKDIIDTFAMYNKVYNTTYKSLIFDENNDINKQYTIFNIEKQLNWALKTINGMMCKYVREIKFINNDFDIVRYIDLFNSAFSEIL